MVVKDKFRTLTLEYNDELFDSKKSLLIVHYFTNKGFWLQVYEIDLKSYPTFKGKPKEAYVYRHLFDDITKQFIERYI